MNNAGPNKLGFTVEQQEAIGRILAMACYGSNLLGTSISPAAQHLLPSCLGMMAAFAKKSYPTGPEAFLAELREVARLCDLEDTFVAYKPTGERAE